MHIGSLPLVVMLAAASPAAEPREPVDWGDCTIDTASPRIRWSFFASACRPFGLVSLAPDTSPRGIWGGGYLDTSERIHGFSHLHMWMLAGVPVLPTTGPMRGPAGSGVHGTASLRHLGERADTRLRDFHSPTWIVFRNRPDFLTGELQPIVEAAIIKTLWIMSNQPCCKGGMAEERKKQSHS